MNTWLYFIHTTQRVLVSGDPPLRERIMTPEVETQIESELKATHPMDDEQGIS